MISGLVNWAIENRLVVFLLALTLIGVGGFAAVNINVEAYPDPAPAIIEVIAQFPGASAEEIERQVTIPLEVALAGMPGLQTTRTKSLFGLGHVRNQFDYGTSFKDARIEVLNRLTRANLPPGVQPQIAPTSPTGEIYRYFLRNPVDDHGQPVYSLTDLKSQQDWTLNREFRRVPRIADVVSFGGYVKRYEIQPDPERLRRFDISLGQLEEAIRSSNSNAGGDYLLLPHAVQVVRGLGLLGDGLDPVQPALLMHDPIAARDVIREGERQRLREIRQIVLAATNNVPIRVGEVVRGGRVHDPSEMGKEGVIVGHQTPSGKICVSLPRQDKHGRDQLNGQNEREWEEIPEAVQGVVLLRKGEQSLPALADVKAKIKELNSDDDSKMLPGVKLETFYDRTNLINRTTETVHENLLVGMVLVTLVLLIFLNHLPSAFIVALNIPMALMFAFGLMWLRGESANLLSLGAVDFGIIVDSSVIMVECIYRRLSSGTESDLSLNDQILRASEEVQRSLLFSTLIMVCALLPLFTMAGPEGRIFGPMANAYAFALGGALLLALTISPVVCRTLMGKVQHAPDNFLVRGLKWYYLGQLDFLLRYRTIVLCAFVAMVVGTGFSLQFLGREFMPELEEGNIYVRGTFPVGVSLEEVTEKSRLARKKLQRYPEAAAVLSQLGRPDDGTDPTGFYNAEIFVPLKDEKEWPMVIEQTGWWKNFQPKRHRTKLELVKSMERDLQETVVGVDWNFSQSIRDNVMETLSGVKGENSLKIIGPDLDELERLASLAAKELNTVRGIESVGIFSIKGQTNLEFAVDRDKCAMWNVSVADLQDVLATAVGGKALTEMVEGEKTFDITIRWPYDLRDDAESILEIPVDVVKNRVTERTATSIGLQADGTSETIPSVTGNKEQELSFAVPRRRLRDLVTPLNEKGQRDPTAKSFTRSGASTIYREQGQRLIAVKFSVRGRDLASTVAEAQKKTKHLFKTPYKEEWSGEFEEMQNAVQRLAVVATLAMVLILVLLYMALRSLLDVAVVFANVLVICMGGIWALFLTGLNFNISAGVGFISVLGVGMMNGLILVSGFNARRFHGTPLEQALKDGMNNRVRPVTMTALTAIFGLLPAAIATRMGSESQKPLAIVVVGGMVMTLLLLNLVPLLYSLYGTRTPPKIASMEH